jgi:hypothetical protein
MRASLDLTRRFDPDLDGYTCSALFLDEATHFLWEGPMKDHTCFEFVRVLEEYRRFVRTFHRSELATVRTDCDPSFTVNHHGATHNSAELKRHLDQHLPAIDFEHSPPHTQAMNPVEGVARHIYHLVNFYLEQSLLSPLAWHDMLMAAVWSVNRLPHPHSADPTLRMSTPFERARGEQPDMSLMRHAPGALVGCYRDGRKPSSLASVSELSYYVCPDPSSAGSIVRSFKSNDLFVTYHLSPLHHGEILRTVAARHALNSGLMRESTGMAEIKASTLAADTLKLLEARRSAGLSGDPDDLVVFLDPVSGRPAKMELAWVDGRLGLVDSLPPQPAVAPPTVPVPDPVAPLPSPVAPVLATPAAATCEQVPTAHVSPPAPFATAAPDTLVLSPLSESRGQRRAPLGDGKGLRAWFRTLDGSTAMTFEPNPKRGESALRYAVY